jgi:hypothetical protein
MRFFGWLLLLPLAGAFWLVITVSNACVKRGRRWLGVLTSLAIGIIFVVVGRWFAIDYGYTVLGWIYIIGGGTVAGFGIWTAVAGEKEEIESREKLERLEKKREEESQNQQSKK